MLTCVFAALREIFFITQRREAAKIKIIRDHNRGYSAIEEVHKANLRTHFSILDFHDFPDAPNTNLFPALLHFLKQQRAKTNSTGFIPCKKQPAMDRKAKKIQTPVIMRIRQLQDLAVGEKR